MTARRRRWTIAIFLVFIFSYHPLTWDADDHVKLCRADDRKRQIVNVQFAANSTAVINIISLTLSGLVGRRQDPTLKVPNSRNQLWMPFTPVPGVLATHARTVHDFWDNIAGRYTLYTRTHICPHPTCAPTRSLRPPPPPPSLWTTDYYYYYYCIWVSVKRRRSPMFRRVMMKTVRRETWLNVCSGGECISHESVVSAGAEVWDDL